MPLETPPSRVKKGVAQPGTAESREDASIRNLRPVACRRSGPAVKAGSGRETKHLEQRSHGRRGRRRSSASRRRKYLRRLPAMPCAIQRDRTGLDAEPFEEFALGRRTVNHAPISSAARASASKSTMRGDVRPVRRVQWIGKTVARNR